MSLPVVEDRDGTSLTVTVDATPGLLYIAQVYIEGTNHLTGSALSKFIPIKPAAWTNLTGLWQQEGGHRTWFSAMGWDLACWISDGVTTSHTWTLDPLIGAAHQIQTNVVGIAKSKAKVWHIEPQQGALSGIGGGFFQDDLAGPVGGHYNQDYLIKTNYGNINRGQEAEFLFASQSRIYSQGGSTGSTHLSESDTSPYRFHTVHEKSDMVMTSYWDGHLNPPLGDGTYEMDVDNVLTHSYASLNWNGTAAATWDGTKVNADFDIVPYSDSVGDQYGFYSVDGATLLVARADYNPFIFPPGYSPQASAEGWHLFE